MYGSQINPNTLQTFMDMEKGMIKEINKEKQKKIVKYTSELKNYFMIIKQF